MALVVRDLTVFTCTPTRLSANGMNHAFAFQPKLVFVLPTAKGLKAKSTYLAAYILRWFTHPKTVTHSSTNRARCWLTSLIRPTLLTTHHATNLVDSLSARLLFCVANGSPVRSQDRKITKPPTTSMVNQYVWQVTRYNIPDLIVTRSRVTGWIAKYMR